MLRMVVASFMVLGLASPSLAVNVYLKDGGVIDAKSAWHSQGKVQVLVNRDTLVTFQPGEVDQKRTFPRQHPAVGKRHGAAPQKGTAVPVAAAVPRKTAEKGAFPSLPSLRTKLKEMCPPSQGGKEGGTIRKQNREMQERLNE